MGAALLLWAGATVAQQIDPHPLYEDNCSDCHAAHAGDFAYERLDVMDGVLVAKTSGLPLNPLLEQGHGQLTPDEIDILLDHLTAIRAADRMFRTKCSICHDRMRELARSELVLKDGELVGRFSGRQMSEFLRSHGRLAPDEVQFMLGKLRSQLDAD